MKTINDNATTTKATKTTVCPSFGAILALIFIVLKLTGCITWSWVWVLAPLWIPLVIIVPLTIITAVVIKKFSK